jgi:hypothetical protein
MEFSLPKTPGSPSWIRYFFPTGTPSTATGEISCDLIHPAGGGDQQESEWIQQFRHLVDPILAESDVIPETCWSSGRNQSWTRKTRAALPSRRTSIISRHPAGVAPVSCSPSLRPRKAARPSSIAAISMPCQFPKDSPYPPLVDGSKMIDQRERPLRQSTLAGRELRVQQALSGSPAQR